MENLGLSIRVAVKADAGRLIPHINQAFALAEPFMTGPRTDAERLAAVMQKGTILLAEDADGALAASIYTEVRGKRGNGAPTNGSSFVGCRGYIGMLAVAPGRQRSGLGRRMMQAAEEYLRERGCVAVDLTVLSVRTELPPIYRSYGYEVTGTEPFEYPHPLKDGVETHCVVMSKDL